MKGISLEAKVGIFFVGCFALIAFISLRLGNYQIGEARGFTLSAVFDSAAGLNTDTPVLLAGMRVGQVTTLKLEKGRARVFFRVKQGTIIANDSKIAIQSRGFLGAKYLEITPGKSETPFKDGNSVDNVVTGAELSDLSAKAGDIADDVKAITANLRHVLGGVEGQEGMQDLFTNLQEITQRLATALADNQERMNQITANVANLTGNMADITDENRRAVREAIGNLPEITKNLATLTANLANLTQNNNEEINTAIKQLALSTTRLQESLTNISSITGKIDNGQGTVGQLINNNETATNINNTIDTVSDFVARIQRIQLALGYRGEYYPESGFAKSYVTLRLQPALDHWYEVGIVENPFDQTDTTTNTYTTTHNAGKPTATTETTVTRNSYYNTNTVRFNAEIYKRWYWFVVHGGLIESYAGVGVQARLIDDHLTLSLEGRNFGDPNYPQLKASIDFTFLDHFFVTAGADNIVDRSVLYKHGQPLWFFGGGIFFTDNDFAALLGLYPVSKF